MLVTSEDQIPIVEVEDSYPSSLLQDFLWFTKVERRIEKTLQQQFPPPAPFILLYIGYYFNIQLQTGQQTISCLCELYVCIIHPLRVPGVVSMGGDSLAAAVSQSFPVVLFLYSADTSQDAAGCLSAAGSKNAW